LVFQIVDFTSINDLKFTYVHLQLQKIFPQVIPSIKGRGKEGRARETMGRKGGEGRQGWDGVNPLENKSWLRPCTQLTR
jgi:hypothetical protein